MNTTKQVNVMIGLLFMSFLVFGAYFATEPAREEDARRVQAELMAKRGAEIFVANCRSCHGLNGKGSEEGGFAPALNTVAFLVLDEANPLGLPPTPTGEARSVHDFLFTSIACGRSNTAMPLWSERYGGPLSDTQVNYLATMITQGRWDLVEKIGKDHDEHQDPPAKPEDILVQDPSTLTVTTGNCGQYGAKVIEFRERNPLAAGGGAPAGGGGGGATDPISLGKTAATANGCLACHTIDGKASVGPSWKGIAGASRPLVSGGPATADDAYLKESITNPNAKLVQGFAPNLMPATFGQSLKPEQVDQIVEYIKSLK
jgi:mono/diheme cytochrome c family protein